MFNYAAGILNENASFENVRDFTGFMLAESREKLYVIEGAEVVEGVTGFGEKDREKLSIPALCVCSEDVNIIKTNELGETVLASTDVSGREHIINLVTYLKSEDIRKIARKAGCKLYTESAGTTVYADNRIMGIFPSDGQEGTLSVRNVSKPS